MTQSATLVWYTSRSVEDPQSAAARILAMTGAKHVMICATAPHGASGDASTMSCRGHDPSEETSDVPLQIKYRLDEREVDRVAALCNGVDRVWIQVGACPLADRIGEAAVGGIPEDISGGFCANDPVLTIGPHDVRLMDPNDETRTVAVRAAFSFGFFCYGLPNRAAPYADRFFALQEVEQVRRQVESIVGPLQQAAIWDI